VSFPAQVKSSQEQVIVNGSTGFSLTDVDFLLLDDW